MRLLAVIAACVALSARATTFMTDFSDLWWDSAENGWGVNVIHQKDVLFLTFFVYGPNNTPTWYSASDVEYLSTTTTGTITFSGALYQTNGPWFGGPYDPAAVTYRPVGRVGFAATSANSAVLSYSVDGVAVQKVLTRVTWRLNDMSGSYIGAIVGTYANCTAGGTNGYAEEPGNITFALSSNGVAAMQTTGTNSCTFNGPYAQSGRMGSWSGTYSCSNGVSGTFNAFEMEANPSSFSARATMHSQRCDWSGRFGGVKRFGATQ